MVVFCGEVCVSCKVLSWIFLLYHRSAAGHLIEPFLIRGRVMGVEIFLRNTSNNTSSKNVTVMRLIKLVRVGFLNRSYCSGLMDHVSSVMGPRSG